MAKKLQLRRGTTVQHGSFTGAVGECTVDTDKDTLVVHDGAQAGGRPLLREDLNNLADDAIGFAKLADIGTDHRLLGRDHSTDGTVAEVQVATDMVVDNAVTYDKLQNVAANRMLGNNTNNAANAIELDAAAVRTFLNVENDADANVPTNLGQTTASNQLTITSSTGDNVVIAEATSSIAGLMSTAHHDKLDGIATGAQVNVATNLGQSTGANALTITSSTGDNVTVAEASSTIAGLMSTAHHDKLDGIATGAQVNVATNLGQTTAANQLTITSSTGDNVVIAEATGSIAGLMSTTHHDKLDGIAASANNYSHPNHTGHVTSTGDGATAINASNAANGRKLQLNVDGGGTQTLEWVELAATAASVPSGAHMLFWDSSAPSGWTIDGNQGDHALRVVGSSGGGTGGSVNFSSVFGSSISTDAHTLTTSQMPSHNHGMFTCTGSGTQKGGRPGTNNQAFTTNSTGGGGSHSHTMNMNIKFCNVIICEKN